MSAVTVRAIGEAAVEDLQHRDLGPTDVLVRIAASGLCHSDVSLYNGDLPGSFPVVIGHEGAGEVVETGAAVTRVRCGDQVVLAAVPSCGTCWFCARAEPYLCERAGRIKRAPFHDGHGDVRGASGLGTFSDVLVVDELAAVPVCTELPPDQLAVIGCAVLTGAGAALNIASIDAGDAVLVVGAGGIGLAAIQGARARGAAPIIAVDPSGPARVAAVASGATHAAAPGDEVASTVSDLTGGRGVDAVIECVGSSATFAEAWPLTRRGGEIVVVGVAGRDQQVPIPLVDVVLSGRRLTGCVYGSSSIHRDVGRYIALAEAGQFDFAALIGQRVALDDIPDVLVGRLPSAGRTVVVR